MKILSVEKRYYDTYQFEGWNILVLLLVFARQSIPYNLAGSLLLKYENYLNFALILCCLFFSFLWLIVKGYFIHHRYKFRGLIFLAFLAIYIAFNYTFLSPETAYAAIKFRGMMANLVIAPLLLFTLKIDGVNWRRIFFVFVIIWLALLCLRLGIAYYRIFGLPENVIALFSNRLNLNIQLTKAGWLGPSHVSRAAIFISIILGVNLIYKNSRLVIGLCAAGLLASTLLLIFSASRGAFISLSISLLLISSKLNRRSIKGAFLLFIAIVGTVILINNFQPEDNKGLFYRFSQIITEAPGTLDISLEDLRGGWRRLHRYNFVMEFNDYRYGNLFGTGIGGYGYHYLREGHGKSRPNPLQKDYPHNFFLETFFDLGWIGLFIFAIVFIIQPVTMWKYVSMKNFNSLVIMVLYINMFINAQFTLDLRSNHPLFTVLLLMLLLSDKDIITKKTRGVRKSEKHK